MSGVEIALVCCLFGVLAACLIAMAVVLTRPSSVRTEIARPQDDQFRTLRQDIAELRRDHQVSITMLSSWVAVAGVLRGTNTETLCNRCRTQTRGIDGTTTRLLEAGSMEETTANEEGNPEMAQADAVRDSGHSCGGAQ